MGFEDGSIILNSDNGTFYAGQTVLGRLVFDRDKQKTIHGICIDFKGFCKVHWTTSHTRRVNDRTETYRESHDSYEEYFRRKVYLFGDASGEHHLQAGHHEFMFEFQVPHNCPTSFEGSKGHIRYRIKATMLTVGMFSSNKEKMLPIRVIAPLDLNLDAKYRDPIELELIQSYCCWCLNAGSSEIQVKLPVGGYCPGQVIPMEVACKNPSRVDIDEIKFAIHKKTEFIAESVPATDREDETICKLTKGPIPAGATRTWTVEMDVPVMDVYNLNACRFIDISYTFKVSTSVSGCHEDSEDISHIFFGTVPLQGFQDNIKNPLQDQMPQIQVENVQGANVYPPPPIISQPVSSPYPNGNQYPNGSPYPGTAPYPTPPNQPHPNVSPFPPNPYPGNSPYPQNQPFPSPNMQRLPNTPYAAGNPPYPVGMPSPYPANPGDATSPYPGGVPSPYPANPSGVPSPYPTNPSGVPSTYPTNPGGVSSPYPGNPGGVPSPYPANPGGIPSPYPANPGGVPSPYPANHGIESTTLLKAGNYGLPTEGNTAATMPLLPPGANVPYPTSPFSSASAPMPGTPSSDIKQPEFAPDTSNTTPYNPEFINSTEKK